MKRVLPHPLFSLAILVMWLLLNGSAAPKTLLFGTILALLVPLTMHALEPPPVRIRRPWSIAKLFAIVLRDIIRSNISVAILALGYRRRDMVAGFVRIPLTIQNPYGLAILSVIITCTPGTLWIQYDTGRSRLLLHVLDLVETYDWPHKIKHDYERLLMEIFE